MSVVRSPLRFTVLIVEDEPFIRFDIADQFERAGWTVCEAASGEDAIPYRTKGSIDVLVTDIRLGGKITGWDVAEAFRADNPSLPVIYTSGQVTLPRREVVDSVFFEKPYEVSVLIATGFRMAQQHEIR
jgi:CheY-like chemotaxis protein